MKNIFLATAFLFAACPSWAAGFDAVASLKSRVVEHRLKNGMTVLVLERRMAPVVSFEMMYRAGGVDEVSGKTGLAHMFEHMMFKGSKTMGTSDYAREKPILEAIDQAARELMAEESKGDRADATRIAAVKKKIAELEEKHRAVADASELDQTYDREGAVGLNAYTAQDVTAFIVSLPANKWKLWPILESDRMAEPVLREFYKERDVVMEERRMRYENSPRGKLWENFVATAYQAHSYGSPTIGWMPDLKRLTVADAEAFFKKHYAPNNAVVAIVGDVRAADVINTLEKYFARVSSQTLPADESTQEPRQEGERRSVVRFDSEPSMIMGFHKPAPPHPDDAVMDMIEQLLSKGRSSRLNRAVVDKKIALSAWASNGDPGERYANLFLCGGSPRKPYGNADLEKALWKELERLKTEMVPERELQKIRNAAQADFIRTLQSNGGMAGELAYNQTILGDWRHVFKYLELLNAVTPDDIHRVANTYFTRDNLTVTVLEKPIKESVKP